MLNNNSYVIISIFLAIAHIFNVVMALTEVWILTDSYEDWKANRRLHQAIAIQALVNGLLVVMCLKLIGIL